MKTVNRFSKFPGVTLEVLNHGKNYYWCCRIQRKNMRFKKYFPFTDEFERIAGETYQKKLSEIK